MATHPFYPDLPLEINDQIFEYVHGGSLRRANFTNPPTPALLTVSRAWYNNLVRFRYVKFEYHSHPDNLEMLWGFLKALVQNPHYRFHVKRLTLSTVYLYRDFSAAQIPRVFDRIWNFGPRRFRARRVPEQDAVLAPGQVAPQGASQIWQWLQVGYLDQDGEVRDEFRDEIRRWHGQALYRQNRPWFEGAMRAVGFHKGPGDLFRNASRVLNHGVPQDGYQCPLVAVMLAYCPNLVHLFLHVWHSEDDRYLDRVMNYATRRGGMWRAHARLTPDDTEPPLAQVETLVAAARKVRHFERVLGNNPNGRPVFDGCQYPFVVDSTKRPYWRLPKLLDFTGISVTSDDSLANLNSASTVRQLTLNSRIMFQLHLDSWLRWCTDLRALSIHIPADEFGSVSDINENNGPVLWNALFTALGPLARQLEYLDIYQECIYPDTDTFDSWFDDNRPCCPPLATFTGLRQLNIPVTILAGWQCIHNDGARFATHLPPNIKTLGVYTDDPQTLTKVMRPQVIQNELLGMVRAAAANGLACLVWDIAHAETLALPDEPMLAEAERLNLYVENVDAGDVLLCAGAETMAAWSIMNRSSMATMRNLAEDKRAPHVIPAGISVHGLAGQMRHVPIPAPPVSVPARAPQAPLADGDDAMDIDG
ncbi:hypothetical protein BJY00DRAFT_289998 [Aspergillus carlsbadensis]|nr:hypothetical protein BJY00DRAFT_289998 [Aspergillus carlsbadensis]